MAEVVTIEVRGIFKDMITPNISNPKNAVDKFTQSVEKSKRQVDRLGGSSAKPKISVVDKASSRISEIDGALSKIGSKVVKAPVKILDYATRPLRAIKDSLFSIKGLVTAIGTGMVANQVLMKPISVADAYSSAKIGFSNLLGEEEGQKMMDDLDEFAKKTPFNTSNVIQNAQNMMAMGWDAKDIIKDMETIGNAAAATGKGTQGLESIVRALSQIKTKGKLSTEELNQLSEAGIAAKAMLAEQLGYGTGDKGIAAMTKDLEKGLIGSETAVQALLKGMGQFDGMMDKTANETVEGLKSQIEDAFEINVVRRWGQGLQDGAKRGLGSILELLDKSEGGLEKLGDTVYEIGKQLSNWAADKLEKSIDKIMKIIDRQDFKDATLGGKIKILWDEVIADPFSKWWDSKGKPYMIEKMGSLGEGIGSALSKGLLAILGIDISGTLGDATSVGGAFASGFAKGFEGAKVWDAIMDAAGRAFTAGFTKLFTGNALEKVIVGGLALKIINGVLSGVSMAKTLWSGTGTVGAGGALTMAGGGLKGLIGSASTASGTLVGSGAIGGLAKVGSLAGSAAYTGGGLALAGAGTLAAGALAGYGVFDTGRDFYKSYTVDGVTDETRRKKSNAYAASGALKATGIAGGALAGAAIGSAVPVVGTLLGGLIGAGVGWLGGKFFGDKEVEKAEKFERSVEASMYSSQEMKDAIEDGTKSAEELDEIFQRACAQDLVDRFGDVELSMEEISKYAQNIVFGKSSESMEKFASASATATQSLDAFKTASEDIKRLNFDMSEHLWKVNAGIDVKLDKEEIAEVKARVQNFMDSAEKALSDNHYEFNTAVDILVKEGSVKNSILATGNKLYENLQKDLDKANKDLEAQYNIALKDGIITADEQKIISEYQKKVSDIISKISDAETEASFTVSKMKFTTGDLTAESFTNLQSELHSQLESYIADQDVALKAAVTDIQLQMNEDPENAEKYNKQIQELVNGYNTNISEMKARVEKIQLEGIAEAFDGAGTVEQLQGAIKALTDEGKNPVDLTFSDINAHLDIGEDAFSEEEKATFTSVMRKALESGITGENALQPTGQVNPTFEIDDKTLQTKVSTVYDGVSVAVKNPFETPFSTTGKVDPTFEVDDKTLQTKVSTVYDGVSKAVKSPFETPFSATGKVGVNLDYYINSGSTATVDINGTSTEISATIAKKANGGYIDKAIQTIVGEAGPEMIIPLSANRRQRGKYLWERAGRAMGLYGASSDESIVMNANGGLYGLGASKLGNMLDSANSGRKTETTQQASGNPTVKVDVGGITIEVKGSGNGISADLEENEDAIVGRIAKMVQMAFENMPLAATD